jgi:hypothetical protein
MTTLALGSWWRSRYDGTEWQIVDEDHAAVTISNGQGRRSVVRRDFFALHFEPIPAPPLEQDWKTLAIDAYQRRRLVFSPDFGAASIDVPPVLAPPVYRDEDLTFPTRPVAPRCAPGCTPAAPCLSRDACPGVHERYLRHDLSFERDSAEEARARMARMTFDRIPDPWAARAERSARELAAMKRRR